MATPNDPLYSHSNPMPSNSYKSRTQAATRADIAPSRLPLSPVPPSNPYYQPIAALLLKQFPAFLPRPVIWEVDITTIHAYFPHLASVTAPEMRERLPFEGIQWAFLLILLCI